MNIESGTFYKTRDGQKAVVYEIIDPFFVGAIIYGETDRRFVTWNLSDGSVNSDFRPCDFDLIAPWVDPPSVDWSKFPKHIIAIAMNKNGEWHGFLDKPFGQNMKHGVWYLTERKYFRAILEIETEDYPDYFGDWRDSLAIRPGYCDATEKK